LNFHLQFVSKFKFMKYLYVAYMKCEKFTCMTLHVIVFNDIQPL